MYDEEFDIHTAEPEPEAGAGVYAELALACFRAAATVQPSSAELHHNVGIALRHPGLHVEGDTKAATENLQEAKEMLQVQCHPHCFLLPSSRPAPFTASCPLHCFLPPSPLILRFQRAHALEPDSEYIAEALDELQSAKGRTGRNEL
jgi:hypothetical protein